MERISILGMAGLYCFKLNIFKVSIMAQNIKCVLQDERGKFIKDADLNFAPINLILWDIDQKKRKKSVANDY